MKVEFGTQFGIIKETECETFREIKVMTWEESNGGGFCISLKTVYIMMMIIS